MKIFCLGDSITYGFGLSDLALRWSDITAQRTGHELINCGVSGDTTGGMLARCQRQIFDRQGDALLFLGGINDISILLEYRSVCANVISIVRQAQAEGLKVILGIPLPLVPEAIAAPVWEPLRDMNRISDLCKQYAAWMRAYAQANQIPVIDFRSAFLLPDGAPDPTLFLDGLHPNETGHRRMADVLYQSLDKILENAESIDWG